MNHTSPVADGQPVGALGPRESHPAERGPAPNNLANTVTPPRLSVVHAPAEPSEGEQQHAMAVVRFILGRKVLPATLKALPDDVFDVAHFAETSKGIKGPEKRYRAVLKFLGDQSDLHLGRTLLLSQAIETAWTTAKTTDPGDELEPKPEVDPHLYAGLTDEDLGLLPLMDVECRPIRWLWKYRLSMGNLALMAGDGGIGKSQVLLAIAAAVSIRGEWPSSEGLAPLGDVVIVSAEDRPDETIKPRLQAMGADLSRITGRWTRDVGG